MANRYFKLAAGNNNWSAVGTWCTLADGSDPGASVPTSADNVYPSTSIAAGATLTVDAAANCLDMDWTGATNTPAFTDPGFFPLSSYGSITFISAMTVSSFLGNLNFWGTGIGNTLTTAGKTFGAGVIVRDVGTLTLQDDLTILSTLFVLAGVLVTNNKTVSCQTFGDNASATAKTATLGSSIISCSAWSFTGAGALTLTANTATSNISGAFAGGSATTYNNVNLNGTAHTISGSNTIKLFGWKPTGNQALTFTDGTTQTVGNVYRTGTGIITLAGTGAGGWAITKQDKQRIVLNKMSISRSTVLPLYAWYATAPFTNGGNNVNWMFGNPPSQGSGGWFAGRH